MKNELTQCWVCKKEVVRTEFHHLFGIKYSDKGFPICINCHDLLDRQQINDFPVDLAVELTKFMEENKYYYLKIWLLKIIKLQKILGEKNEKLQS